MFKKIVNKRIKRIWNELRLHEFNPTEDTKECWICNEVKNGKYYIVKLGPGVSKYEFHCYDCKDIIEFRRWKLYIRGKV